MKAFREIKVWDNKLSDNDLVKEVGKMSIEKELDLNTDLYTSSISSILKEYYEKYSKIKNIEIEFRIGRMGVMGHNKNNFFPNISSNFYEKIDKMLKSNKKWNNIEKKCIIDKKDKKGYRLSKNGNKEECLLKIKLCDIDIKYENHVFRLSFSIEEKVSNDCFNKYEEVIKRKKERTSYIYKNWSYDLTKVKMLENTIEKEILELELEILDPLKYDSEYILYSSLLKMRDFVYMFEGENINKSSRLELIQIKDRVKENENKI